MNSRMYRTAVSPVVFTILLVTVGMACGGGATPEATIGLNATPEVTATLEPTDTPTATAEPTVTPEPTDGPTTTTEPIVTPEPTAVPTAAANPPLTSGTPELVDVELNADAVWREIFDKLPATEQSCIRDALGDDHEAVLVRPVLPEGSSLDKRQVPIYNCLGAEIANPILLFITLTFIEMFTGVSDEEVPCLQELIAGMEMTDLVETYYGSPENDEFMVDLISCVPGLLFSFGMSQTGWLKPEYFSGEELYCISDLTSGADRETILAALDDSPESEKFSESLLTCLPDLNMQIALAMFQMGLKDLTEDETYCLKEKDWDVEREDDLSSNVASCVPYLFIRSMLANLGKTLEDLTDEERSCVFEQTDDIGLTDESVTPEEEVHYSEAIAAQISCVPGLMSLHLLSAFRINVDDLEPEQIDCLQDVEAESDLIARFLEFSYNDILGSLVSCIPDWEDSAR